MCWESINFSAGNECFHGNLDGAAHFVAGDFPIEGGGVMLSGGEELTCQTSREVG